MVQLDAYLESIVEIIKFETGEVDARANAIKVRRNTGKLAAYDKALEECKQALR